MKFLTPLLLIGISVALFLMFINPTYQTIGVLREEGSQYTAALDRAKQAGVKRDQLVSKYNSFSSEDLKRLLKVLPDRVDNIKLVVDVNNLAAKYGTSIRDIKVGDNTQTSKPNAIIAEAASKPYGTLSVGFGVTMSYENFLRFLNDIEQSLRLTDVSAIEFDTIASGTSGNYNYIVTVKTYWLKS